LELRELAGEKSSLSDRSSSPNAMRTRSVLLRLGFLRITSLVLTGVILSRAERPV
jgi:hypothetical protein